MKVKYLSLPLDRDDERVVLGLGYFDGVHLGHQDLISKVVTESKALKVKAAIFTFDNNLHTVLGNKYQDGSLTPLEDKLEIFENMGVDICYILKFNRDIAHLSYVEFEKEVLSKINIEKVVCGTDFRYGFKGEGTAKELERLYPLDAVRLLEMAGHKVSSTFIQKLLVDGKINEANAMLGYEYTVKGTVVKGKEFGKKLGFPTANIEASGYVFPKNGVYKVKVIIDNKEYLGIANVGIHPTVGALDKRIVEVHILDFNREIYGSKIAVKFLRFIRDEMKFASVEDLKKQIKSDTFSAF